MILLAKHRAILTIFVVLSLASGQVLGQAAPKRHALLIGVTSYEASQLNQPPLLYPEADAKAIGEKFRGHGYSVTMLLGEAATQSAIRAQLAELNTKGNSTGVVVVGLFGHGIEFHGSEEAMFCPYDAGLRFTADADGKNQFGTSGEKAVEPDPKTLISMSEVLNALKLCKAGNKLLLADCCRNDPNSPRGRAFGASVKLSDLPDKTACLFACSTGEKAYEHSDWRHGALTKALLDHFAKLESPESDILEITGRMSRSIDSMVRASTDGKKGQTLNPIIKGIVELKLDKAKSAGQERDPSIPSGGNVEPKQASDGPTYRLGEFFRKQGYLDKLTLYPGLPAPALPPLNFFEGEPINQLKPGRVYVIDTFASWCDPCVTSLTVLARLQAKYPQVVFISIDVSGSSDLQKFLATPKRLEASRGDTAETKKFKEEFNKWWNGKAGIRMCADGSATEGVEGKISTDWQAPALSPSIPTTFVIDSSLKIAWIGHPRDMEKENVIESIVSGTWDVTKARSDFFKAQGLADFQSRHQVIATDKNKIPKALAELDLIAANADSREEMFQFKMFKLQLQQFSGAPDLEQLEFFRSALSECTSDPTNCNGIAWVAYESFIGERHKSKEILRLAADSLEGTLEGAKPEVRASSLDTLAHLEHALGNLDRAITLQTSAVELSTSAPELKNFMAEYLKELRAEQKK